MRLSSWELLQRVQALSHRNSARCNQAVQQRKGKELDQLLTQSERISKLFWRVHDRYVAERGPLEW